MEFRKATLKKDSLTEADIILKGTFEIAISMETTARETIKSNPLLKINKTFLEKKGTNAML